jgi:RNase P/RNase MRP subunit p29
MKSNVKYFIYQDMIGVILYAKHKTNPSWSEFRNIGRVTDETKHTLVVQNADITKHYIKEQYLFRSWVPTEDGQFHLLEFDGAKLVGLPENRIKTIKKIRRKLH